MLEKIKKLFNKNSKKTKSKSIKDIYGKYDVPNSAAWKGVNTKPRGSNHPGNTPF